jgi:hypothetical protein
MTKQPRIKSRSIPAVHRYFLDAMPRLSAPAHGHHRSAQARQTMPSDLRHYMTPADAPMPPTDRLPRPSHRRTLAAEPSGTASRTGRVLLIDRNSVIEFNGRSFRRNTRIVRRNRRWLPVRFVASTGLKSCGQLAADSRSSPVVPRNRKFA